MGSFYFNITKLEICTKYKYIQFKNNIYILQYVFCLLYSIENFLFLMSTKQHINSICNYISCSNINYTKFKNENWIYNLSDLIKLFFNFTYFPIIIYVRVLLHFPRENKIFT